MSALFVRLVKRKNLPKEASNNVLEEADGLLLYELANHVAENSTNGVEALVSLTDVRKTDIVEKNLLYDKDGYGLAELGACFHDAQAKRDDLGCEKEVDDF